MAKRETQYSKLPYYRTEVSEIKTWEDIEKFLKKYGLIAIRLTKQKNMGAVEFGMDIEGDEIYFRYAFDLPDKDMHKRQVLRGLFHYLKARMTSVDFGIRTIEQEFFQEMIVRLPNGITGTIKELLGERKGLIEKVSDLLPYKKEE